MKKTYVKPALVIESFMLSQNIALSCGVPGDGTSVGKPNHSDRFVCGWDVDGIIAWLDSKVCNYLIDENTEFDGVCYNNPSSGTTIFAS